MGFMGEIIYGYYLNSNIVLEGGIGYFHDGTIELKDIRGMSFMFSVKGVYPVENFKTFAGGGFGVYSTKYKRKITEHLDYEDNNIIFGGHLLIGANVDISSAMFIGVEGKYLLTEKGKFNSLNANINGIATMLSFGLRF
jgi:opacity protein-like surface antigen